MQTRSVPNYSLPVAIAQRAAAQRTASAAPASQAAPTQPTPPVPPETPPAQKKAPEAKEKTWKPNGWNKAITVALPVLGSLASFLTLFVTGNPPLVFAPFVASAVASFTYGLFSGVTELKGDLVHKVIVQGIVNPIRKLLGFVPIPKGYKDDDTSMPETDRFGNHDNSKAMVEKRELFDMQFKAGGPFYFRDSELGMLTLKRVGQTRWRAFDSEGKIVSAEETENVKQRILKEQKDMDGKADPRLNNVLFVLMRITENFVPAAGKKAETTNNPSTVEPSSTSAGTGFSGDSHFVGDAPTFTM
jgi:hypothetical protein